MEERIKSEVLIAMKTARDNAEAFTDGSVDDITQAILTAVAESVPPEMDNRYMNEDDRLGYSKGYSATANGFNKCRNEVLAQLGKEE